MTPFDTHRHTAATALIDLIDQTSPDERAVAGPKCAYPAVHAIARFAIALAVDQMADITRDLMQKRAERPIVPPQTDKAPEP